MASGRSEVDDRGVTARRRRSTTAGLAEGQRVVLTAGVLRGKRGTLVRPARVVLDPGWLVQLDGRPLGLRRLRVATWALGPLEERDQAA
jgi:hypothetical protein